MHFGFSGTQEGHYAVMLGEEFSAYISLFWAAFPGDPLPFVLLLLVWAFLVTCLSIKRSVRMSTQSRLAWLVWFPLALPCCQTQFPAEGFGLMKMQWVRGHYPSETCLKCCCSPHFLDWWHLQHCCSLSTDKGSGWKKKKKSTNWMTNFKTFSPAQDLLQ